MSIDKNFNDKAGKITIDRAKGSGILSVSGLFLLRPDGEMLIDMFSLSLKPGDRLVLTGPSGCGKSTLLRALIGFWPYGGGSVSWPETASILCVPQKPYLPNFDLRGILSYPRTEPYSDDQLKDALRAAGHERLIPFLDDPTIDGAKLSRSLSLGEQQRLVLARILLHKPDILMLDEVTASLDDKASAFFYETLVRELPRSMIISVAHNKAVIPFHTLHAAVGTNKRLSITPVAAAAGEAPKPAP